MPQILHSTMINVASAGGGLDIDCFERPMKVDTMVAIALAAAGSGKHPPIVFRNCERLPVDGMIRIAEAGEGCVTFVVS